VEKTRLTVQTRMPLDNPARIWSAVSDMKKEFLKEINAFMDAHAMKWTQFGKLAMNDKSFVNNLMIDGRDVKISTIEKVRKFMRTYKERNGATKVAAE